MLRTTRFYPHIIKNFAQRKIFLPVANKLATTLEKIPIFAPQFEKIIIKIKI
jgi:hypothetical protein